MKRFRYVPITYSNPIASISSKRHPFHVPDSITPTARHSDSAADYTYQHPNSPCKSQRFPRRLNRRQPHGIRITDYYHEPVMHHH
ncbi:hypothetical protein BT63DRAFT_427800 [Microthyrium microscopicum]|uniref:Uncharacterized protein n=1 Tax=Microthyrium microscopicum TaxID=703497 RepID=A0A6A6U407_9PEZI|nr:hypothetical protein BT63DRAFT_427800 [Microthyrium microscopicum]